MKPQFTWSPSVQGAFLDCLNESGQIVGCIEKLSVRSGLTLKYPWQAFSVCNPGWSGWFRATTERGAKRIVLRCVRADVVNRVNRALRYADEQADEQ